MKKTVKNTRSKIKESEQKKNHVYGVIGMVALFFVGVIFGYVINGSNHINRSIMSEAECKNLAGRIKNLIQTNNFDQLKIANEIYSENCLNRDFDEQKPLVEQQIEDKKLPDTTCGKIELLLTERLFPMESNANGHITNAKIYANLSERGCPENSEKYKELAASELEIARALKDDNLEQIDSIEIVETYKRLQMQQEAARMIEKAKRLTNPAIDFIIQLEKIIEE